MHWFRLHHKAFLNEKIRGLSDREEHVWLRCLAIANQQPDRDDGTLPSDWPKYYYYSRYGRCQFKRTVERLCQLGLIDVEPDGTLKIHHWREHQCISDDAKPRAAKQYAKKKNVPKTTPKTSTVFDPKSTIENDDVFQATHAQSVLDSTVECTQNSTVNTSTDITDVQSTPLTPLKGECEGVLFEELQPVKASRQKSNGHDVEALEFYAIYPRKKAREDFLKAWKQMEKERPPLPELVAVLRRQMAAPDWPTDITKVKYPAGWIRGKRWEDEPSTIGGNNNGGIVRPLYAFEQVKSTDYDEAGADYDAGGDGTGEDDDLATCPFAE